MKEQLLELFGKSLFQFHFRGDGIIDYRSVVPILMDGMYCDIKVEFFDNGSNLFNFETFEDISERFKLFEIVKLPIIYNQQREVLFHQKYDEDEFY